MLCAINRYTMFAAGEFLQKCTGYIQCIYQNAPVIISALVNALVIVSALNCFLPKRTRYSQCTEGPVVAGAFLPKRTGYSKCVYQNGPVIISAWINAPVIVSVLNCF